jgi:Golgi phosphoprotein 3 (GPP34)
MDLLLAEQLLLLFLDDDRGSDTASWGGDPGLAGALLLDLTAARAVEERDGALVARPGVALEHPALRAAYGAIAASEKPRDAKGWVGRLPRELKPLAATIADRLVERGVLAEERRKVLGLFPAQRFPQTDPEPERALRERLRAVLTGTSTPTPQEAMLIALLQPYDLVGKLVPREERKEAKRRAKALADGGAAAQAVDATVKGVQAAVLASATAAIAASTAATAGS